MRGCSRKAADLALRTGNLVFTGTTDDPETLTTLRRMGFTEPGGRGGDRARLAFRAAAGRHQPRAREVLTELVPPLLAAFARQRRPRWSARSVRQGAGPDAGRRGAVLHPEIAQACSRATSRTSSGSAPRLAEIVASRPHLLDAIIDPTFSAPAQDVAPSRRGSRRPSANRELLEDFLDRLRETGQHKIFLVGARTMFGHAVARAGGRGLCRRGRGRDPPRAARTSSAASRLEHGQGSEAVESPCSAWVGLAPAR